MALKWCTLRSAKQTFSIFFKWMSEHTGTELTIYKLTFLDLQFFMHAFV